MNLKLLYMNEERSVIRFISITIMFIIIIIFLFRFFIISSQNLQSIIIEDLERDFETILRLSRDRYLTIIIQSENDLEGLDSDFLDLKPLWNIDDKKSFENTLVVLSIKKSIEDLNISFKAKAIKYFSEKSSNIYYFFDDEKERIYAIYKINKKFIFIEKNLSKFYEYQNFMKNMENISLLAIFILYIITFFLTIKYSLKDSEIDELNLNHSQRLKILKESALTDKLTGAFNRLKFDDSLKEFIMLSSRFKSGFSLIIFDIDHFKKFNDTYGHQLGDEVLVWVSKISKDTIREVDIFARWGGEEFVVLLPNSDLKEALICAERLRENIAEFDVDYLPQITCSFGVSEYVKGDNKDTVLKRADELLYSAKNCGRNCVKG